MHLVLELNQQLIHQLNFSFRILTKNIFFYPDYISASMNSTKLWHKHKHQHQHQRQNELVHKVDILT